MRFSSRAARSAAPVLLLAATFGGGRGPALVSNPAPAAASAITQYGVATWYGPGFEGEVAFCGQTYHSAGFTAASNTLPCGSVIDVTNQENGRSVRVTVTDRGAFQYPIIADLSVAAFGVLADHDQGIISVVISTAG